ncbi:unannotated protein [freshwater metagenome]|uniref:Unannotated protein n=1 Tax=freshwater metagenome TaxID=449393 RepID=A0A6J6SB96_9ZZZZ
MENLSAICGEGAAAGTPDVGQRRLLNVQFAGKSVQSGDDNALGLTQLNGDEDTGQTFAVHGLDGPADAFVRAPANDPVATAPRPVIDGSALDFESIAVVRLTIGADTKVTNKLHRARLEEPDLRCQLY